jgi:ketosteroid isomerase-like protein
MLNTLLCSIVVIALAQLLSPQAAVDGLLAADRAFSTQAASLNVVDALAAMFTDDVVMPAPPATLARGKGAAIDALRQNPDNVNGRVEWAPIRGGIAADGHHGFTVGYMTLTRPDKTRVPIKYVAYWLKQPSGWRVAVYKRARSGEGAPSRDMLPAALPARLVGASADAAAIARYKASLGDTERAFSDEAQKIGIGPAFTKYGSADAVNVGPPTGAEFVRGAEAIGRGVGGTSPGPPSPVSWAPADVIAASSGDLGVTFGMIRQNNPPPAGQPRDVPFITIWRRPTPSDPWRYVAE